MARIIGDNNNNRLIGTLDSDLIRSLGGADRIAARGGNDRVRAGDGDDTVKGQDGDDKLNGNEGGDRISGGSGNDRIKGGSGNDTLSGGAGNDRLRGGEGDDRLRGGQGGDLLIGDSGDDTMNGGAGNDTMVWNPGDGDDIMRGGAGIDTAKANGGDADEAFTLKQEGRRALFDRVDPSPFNLDITGTEIVEVNANEGNDSFQVEDLSNTNVTEVVFNGGEGNDTLDANETNVRIVADGGTGNDTLTGGDADDLLQGGDGNDVIDGDAGDDIMLGGDGDDQLIWNPGGGSDVMVGGEGDDIARFNGDERDEQFTLEQNGNEAIFNRVNPSPVTLTITEAETMEVNGNEGNDSLVVSDVSNTDVTLVVFDGGEGDDTLDAENAGVVIEAYGRAGDDTLTGSNVDDTLTGGAGVDVLTGNLGRDRFVYGNNALGTADRIIDYTIADDQFVLNGAELGIDNLVFQNDADGAPQANANVIILTQGAFGDAEAAAQSINDETQVATQEGIFVFFDEALGIGRLVYSQNLGDGGDVNVLANMENLTEIDEFANFTSDNFVLA